MPKRLCFTSCDEANELIGKDPMALLIGFALDQHRWVPVRSRAAPRVVQGLR
ncbi:MAG: hypothetical protein JWM60_2529 [Solirubrobacterales bacterium]|nr:hypothetical protein [Solirubrobacterales bacterium]